MNSIYLNRYKVLSSQKVTFQYSGKCCGHVKYMNLHLFSDLSLIAQNSVGKKR